MKKRGGAGEDEMEGREATEMRWDGWGGRAQAREEGPRYEGGALNEWEEGAAGKGGGRLNEVAQLAGETPRQTSDLSAP